MTHNSIAATELNVIVYDESLPDRARWIHVPLYAVVRLAAHFRDPGASADEFNGSLAELLRQLLDEPAGGDDSPAGSEGPSNYIWRAVVASILDRYGVRTWQRRLLQARTFAIKLEQCRLGLRFDLRAVLNDFRPHTGEPNASKETAAACASLGGGSARVFSSPAILSLPVRPGPGSDGIQPGKKLPRGSPNGRSVPPSLPTTGDSPWHSMTRTLN